MALVMWVSLRNALHLFGWRDQRPNGMFVFSIKINWSFCAILLAAITQTDWKETSPDTSAWPRHYPDCTWPQPASASAPLLFDSRWWCSAFCSHRSRYSPHDSLFHSLLSSRVLLFLFRLWREFPVRWLRVSKRKWNGMRKN